MDTTNLKIYLPFNNSPTEDLCNNDWTVSGSPTVSDGTLYLNGSSYLKLVNPFVFSGQDFTIATEINFSENQSNSEPCIWQLYGGTSYRVQFEIYNRNKLLLWANGDKIWIESSVVITDGVTHHVEVDYSNSVWYLFLDGQLVGTYNYTLPNGNLPLYIGMNNRSGAKIKGYLDNFIFYDGSALHTQNFTPPTAADYSALAALINSVIDFSLDFDSSRRVEKSVDINFETSRRITNSVSIDFDTLRRFKNVWRYENFGTADLLSVAGTTVSLDAAKYKSAFYQSARAKCFDIPATDEIWIKFDVYSSGSRWRAYNDTSNGYVDGISSYSNYIDFWASEKKLNDVFESDAVLSTNSLQTVLLHMISGSTNGIIEVWLDGSFIHQYTGNVNNGNDFEDFYLQSDGEGTTFSNVIISNSQISLTDNAAMPFDCLFDTLRQLFAPVDLSVDFDTKRQIVQSLNLSADTSRVIVKSVDIFLDSQRKIFRSVNFLADTLRKIPFKFFCTPAANQIVFDSTISAGLQYIEISLAAGQLIDKLSFVTSNDIDILQQVQGQILDYKFNLRVEDYDRRGILKSCKCCSDVDELLYTQIAYTLSKTTWNGGTYVVDSKKSTVNSTTWIMLDKPRANASAHAQAIAKKLTLNTFCLFDDFISTVDIKQEGVTYQDLISEIFNWSLRVPHKQINLFIRDHSLFIIQRGHEQNFISLDISDFAQDLDIHKSLVRTSFGVTRNSQSVERSDSSNGKKGHYENILGSPLPEEYQDPPEDDDENPPEPTEPARNLPDHVTTFENGITTDINYDYDEDGNLIKTSTTTVGGEIDTLVVVTNHYSIINGEKLLDTETTDEYEAEYQDAVNPSGEPFVQRVWNWVDGKVIKHTYTTVGQQHISSVSSDGSVKGSVTASAHHNDKPTPYDDKKNSNFALNNNAEKSQYNPYTAYTYQDGVKVEILGYKWVDDSTETNNTVTGTLDTVKLYDSSFPVGDSKAKQITEDIKWLNRKIQETVSGTIYNFKHIFDFNDKIILNGNIYYLQSNSFVMSDDFTNKQFIQLVRWY